MSMDEEDVASQLPYAQQPSSTAEAQKYSRQILDRTLSGKNEAGEAAILSETQKNASNAIQALRAAQASIAKQSYDPRLAQLAFASAVGQGNRSGSTWEGVASGFGAMHDEIAKQQEFNLKRQELLNKYGVDIAESPQGITNMKLELQKLHEQQEGPLARSALTQLGRSIVPGSAMIAPNARVAMSEGLQYGTPAFFKRVQQLDLMDQRNKAASSGTDSAPAEPDHTDEAQRYGVPATALYPWAGMSSKEARQALNTERSKALTELSKDDEGVQQAQSIQRDLDRFMYINKRFSTGSIQGIPGIHAITGLPDDAKELDKISARIGPLMRQPGMGRMTNYDLQTFMSSVPGRDKSYDVNKDIKTAMDTAIDNQLAFNEFKHNYFGVHKTLQGAREAWDQYLRDNPIFDPKSEPGSFTANPHRLNYKEYFRKTNSLGLGGGSTNPGVGVYPDVTDSDRHDPVFAGLSDKEIHDVKSAPPAKARGGPIRGYASGGKVARDDIYKADLEDLARSFEQGATYQWGDELNAGLRPGPYRSNVVNERGQQERFSSTHPWTNTGLEVAGGAASTAAAAKAAQVALEHMRGKAGMLGALATRAAGLMPKNILGKSAVVGGAGGALAGAGAAQDASEIPGQAAVHGALGAVAGPLAGLVAKYGTNSVVDLVNKLRGASVPNAAKKVLGALAADNTTADEIRARLTSTARNTPGVPTTMADVGGPNVQALAQAVATKPGPKVQQFVNNLEQRQAGTTDRVKDLVNRALAPDDYQAKLGELTKALYQNAKPLYDQAYAAFPKVKSEALSNILDTPSGQKAAKNAFKLMQDEGVPIGKPDVTGMVKKPSLQYLDYVKRALDDMVEKNTRSGNLNQARVIKTMRNQLRDELDTVTRGPNGQPGLYQQARQQYAGDSEVLDALRLGRDDLMKADPKELAEQVKNMSWAEQDALRTGAAENLFQQVSKAAPNANPAMKLVGNDDVKARLQALFPANQKAYDNFVSGLTQEMQNFARSRKIISTAAQARGAQAAQGLDAGPPMGEMAHEAALVGIGHAGWAGARLVHALGNKMMPSGTAEGVADLLGTQPGPAGKATLDTLRRQAQIIANRQDAGNMAGTLAAGATGPLMAPEPWGNLQDNSGGAPAQVQ